MSDSLPFNTTLIRGLFTPLPPEQEQDTAPGYWAILQGNSLVVSTDSQELLSGDPLPIVVAPETEPLKIGLWQGEPLRVMRIASGAPLPSGYEALPFQGPDTRLDNTLATIAGRAAQILHWERRSRFCSCCGGELVRIKACWGKRCTSCNDEHFPHIHPCIIVLVRRGAELLLIRNAAWNVGRFSLVAGFLDFGESLEECVQREVLEEAGVEVTNIRYLGSQCWPFPSQQMIGFLADYAGGEVKPDGVEVVEAEWFHEDALPLSPGGKRSISRWIIDKFGLTIILVLISLIAACSRHERHAYRPDSTTPNRVQKPYTVSGERYEPLSSHEGFVQSGIASWYGSDFHGKKTSNGETYDMYSLTAAHKTLPLGVYVKVSNRSNGRDIVVRINDRGPFVAGRIIDLSYFAAKELRIVDGGTAPVKIEALGYLAETVKGKMTYRPPSSYDKGSFGIQVGAFSALENAQRMVDSVKKRYGVALIQEADVNGTRYYRVRVGNYASLKEAELMREQSSDKVLLGGFVVALDGV